MMPVMRVALPVLICSALLPCLPAQQQKSPVTAPPLSARELLVDLAGGDRDRGFKALCKLAVLGYRADVAKRLLAIAVDAREDESWRAYAAMGLGNMHAMPAAVRQEVRAALRAALQREGGDCPDGVLDQLVRSGDAAFVRETLGDALHGRRPEISVLEQVHDVSSHARLLAILAAATSRRAADYNCRAAVGRALIAHGDVLGVDVLVRLLPPDAAPGAQYRRNVYAAVAPLLAGGFAAMATDSDAALDAACASVTAWWQEHGDGYQLPRTALPRQAR